MRTLPLFSVALVACGPSVDAVGDWTGEATCEGFSIPMTMTTTGTEDDGEVEGTGLVEFTSSDNQEISVSFDVDMSWERVRGGNAEMMVEFSNCEEASAGPIVCWFAENASFFVSDQELSASLVGFVVNDGNCEWDMEVSN